MSGSGWSVRLFEANDYRDEATIDHMDNFTKGKNRQLDSIRTYSGMYGIDNYMIWNIHKDLPNYDFSTVAIDLSIFMYKSTDIISFQEFYRVQDIKYNANKSQYTLFAISETSVRLHSKLIKYNVTSLSYKENRTPKQLLKETIQAKNIFYVIFHDDYVSTKGMLDYQYRYFDIDPEWTVLDLIQYIANDNQYEWCVNSFVDKETNKPYFFLHIGHELKASIRMNATKKLEKELDNISESVYTMKITTNSSPMEPMANWEEVYRCLWCKHTAGRGGGISRGCFAPTGMGHFDKFLYLRTLEGSLERNIGYSMLTSGKKRFPSVSIGNIIADEGVLKDDEGKSIAVSPYIDSVSVQKNPKTYPIREPHNITINKGDDDILIQHNKERVSRSTPYLDYEAGLLFPSPRFRDETEDGDPIPLEVPPNSLLFNVDGKSESAVVGPFVYGNGDKEGYPIPFKERDDFRLRFTDGAEIFYDHSAQIWFFQAPKGFAFKNVVTPYDKNTTKHLTEEWDKNKSMFQIYENNVLFDTPTLHMHMMDGGCFQVVPKTGPQPDDPYRRYAIVGDNEGGEFTIEAQNDITINIKYMGALSDGIITINTSEGTINIGNDASVIRLAGGGNKISHGDHKHFIGNMGIVVPAHTVAEGSDITEVD